MDKIIFIIIFFIFLLYIITVIRKQLYNYITNIDEIGILRNTESKSYYNNYYNISNKKNSRQIINNIAFIRDGLISNIYDGDIKILNINQLLDDDSILIFNNNDCNFEIFLAQKFLEKKKNIKIVIAKTNIIEVEKCQKLITNVGFNELIEVKYLNDLQDISNTFSNNKFDRIVLRENIGRYNSREQIFSSLKNLLKDESSFLYLKTLVFSNLENEDNFMVKKQFDIIDFWNYNFSTKDDIINDLKNLNYEVKYKSLNVLFLSIFYNPQDILNILKLYFVDLDLGISNIIDWLAIYTLNLLHIKAYKVL